MGSYKTLLGLMMFYFILVSILSVFAITDYKSGGYANPTITNLHEILWFEFTSPETPQIFQNFFLLLTGVTVLAGIYLLRGNG